MKKLIFILVVLLFLPIQSIGEAHSGRTDSSGGHNCSEKSQANGLCSGYHYHNGGEEPTSEDDSSTSTVSSQSLDKDCTDFNSYEEVVEYWNSNGYSRTNDPERLDGWGNTVDDGIPCEAPDGYDITIINGSDAQIAKIEAEKDMERGEDEGYSAGLEAGSNGEEEKINVDGSDAYMDGYSVSYEKGYEEGLEIFEEEKKKATEAGQALGSKQDKLEVPSIYKENEQLSTAFEDSFRSAVSKREEAEKKEYESKGYNDGKKDINNEPKDIKEIYINAYKDGYEKGQKELQDSYIEKGYDDAFSMLEYKEPDYENQKFIEWYERGFKSNKEVEDIQEVGYNSGFDGETYSLPKTYEKSELIYKHYYEQGYDDYVKEKKEDTATAIGGGSIVVIGWLVRRFYVAKKMVG